MITEKVDKHSGAILFKKDQDSLKLDRIMNLLKDLEKRVGSLERAIIKDQK